MDTILAHSRPNQQAIFESLIEPLSELLKESPGQNDFFRSIELFQIAPQTPSCNCFQNGSPPGIFGINFTSRRTAPNSPNELTFSSPCLWYTLLAVFQYKIFSPNPCNKRVCARVAGYNPYALLNETASKPVCVLGKKQNTETPSKNRPFREPIFPQNRYAPVISFAACFSMPLLPKFNRVYFLFMIPMIWMSWMLLEVFHNSFAARFIFPTKIFRLLEIPFYRTYHPLHY